MKGKDGQVWPIYTQYFAVVPIYFSSSRTTALGSRNANWDLSLVNKLEKSAPSVFFRAGWPGIRNQDQPIDHHISNVFHHFRRANPTFLPLRVISQGNGVQCRPGTRREKGLGSL
jgi:hypothetical protein